MLAEPTKEEVEKYLDFAYGLALDPARSGYPTYTDGIKTREDFEEAAWKGFYNDHRKILLFESNGRVLDSIYLSSGGSLSANGDF